MRKPTLAGGNNNFRNSVLEKLDVTKPICEHLIGTNHTDIHRIFTGAIIMVAGVSLVKFSMSTSYFFLQFTGDILGYLIHGIGAIPILKKLEERNGYK